MYDFSVYTVALTDAAFIMSVAALKSLLSVIVLQLNFSFQQNGF
jgi:hypothetical protein